MGQGVAMVTSDDSYLNRVGRGVGQIALDFMGIKAVLGSPNEYC